MRYFIITGASKGLGSSLTKKAIGSNSHIMCISRSQNIALHNLARQKASALDYFPFDLSDIDGIPGLMQSIFSRINRTNAESVYLINNAGILGPIKPIGEAEVEEIKLNVTTNLLAPLILTSQFLRHLKELKAEKKIINISSKASRTPRINWLCYGSSKSGIDNLTRAVALEQQGAKHPAKIISFYPGVMDTDMHKENAKARHFSARLAAFIRSLVPPFKSRIRHPDLVADCLLNYIECPEFGEELFVDFDDLAHASLRREPLSRAPETAKKCPLFFQQPGPLSPVLLLNLLLKEIPRTRPGTRHAAMP